MRLTLAEDGHLISFEPSHVTKTMQLSSHLDLLDVAHNSTFKDLRPYSVFNRDLQFKGQVHFAHAAPDLRLHRHFTADNTLLTAAVCAEHVVFSQRNLQDPFQPIITGAFRLAQDFDPVALHMTGSSVILLSETSEPLTLTILRQSDKLAAFLFQKASLESSVQHQMLRGASFSHRPNFALEHLNHDFCVYLDSLVSASPPTTLLEVRKSPLL